MTKRVHHTAIVLMGLLLAACSSKPVKHSTVGRNTPPPSQSASEYQHFPLYHDESFDSDRPGKVYSSEFPRPPELEPQIAFWRKVYAKWGRAQIAIHDKVHLGIIYDVFEVPGDVGNSLTPTQKDYIQQRLADWRGRLAELEDKMASGRGLDADDRELAQHIGEHAHHRNAVSGASERLRYQRGMKERFMRGLEIGREYDNQFRRIFRNAGLPEDLAYLPHVESSFQYNAHSSAGALGIWQFTAGAAKMFMNDASAAARLDPINSTHGAARYLAYAYDKLGSWPLAVTSYNHGIGGMQRARNQHGHDFMGIVRHYNSPQFGFASRNYYAEFLAARDIASDPARYLYEDTGHERHALSSKPSRRPVEPVEPAPPAETAAPAEPDEPAPTLAAVASAEPTAEATDVPAEGVVYPEGSPVAETPTETEPATPASESLPPVHLAESATETAYQPANESAPLAAEPAAVTPVETMAEPEDETEAEVRLPAQAAKPAIPGRNDANDRPPAAALATAKPAALATTHQPPKTGAKPQAAPAAPKKAGQPLASPADIKPAAKASKLAMPTVAPAGKASGKPVANAPAPKSATTEAKPKTAAAKESGKKSTDKMRVAKR